MGERNRRATWKELEKVVERIQRVLAPGATVTTKRVPDRSMTRRRQVDVIVTQPISGHTMTLLFECRDHGKPVGAPYVESIVTKRGDLRASKAIIVSASAFTKGAREKAAHHGIDLMSLEEASQDEWPIEWLVPREIPVTLKRFELVGAQFESGDHFAIEDIIVADGELGPGVTSYHERFMSSGSRRWSFNDVFRHVSAQNAAMYADVPESGGTRLRREVVLDVKAFGLSIAKRGGGSIGVRKVNLLVDLYYEHRSYPIRVVRYGHAGGDGVAQYAEAEFPTSDLDGNETVGRLYFVRDAEGRMEIRAEMPRLTTVFVVTNEKGEDSTRKAPKVKRARRER